MSSLLPSSALPTLGWDSFILLILTHRAENLQDGIPGLETPGAKDPLQDFCKNLVFLNGIHYFSPVFFTEMKFQTGLGWKKP